ncbi:hypothetical protein H8B06_08855 [Sphingobacterium sp. DN00404]|uniref:Uncharacterized protein n=1 Tax=Sphingobacterium micropteri TaxID=2763501 RepID=A0ABR7YNQ4_9SPHI|nr:hypothetical protein [Sphingobacterium micropteri]
MYEYPEYSILKYLRDPELSLASVPPYAKSETSADAVVPTLIGARPQITRPPHAAGSFVVAVMTTGLCCVPSTLIVPPCATAM